MRAQAPFSSCQQLVALSVEHNTFNGVIPPALFVNPMLHFISLEHNLLSGTIPSEIGHATCLQKAWLGNNKLEGSIPQTLKSCRMLHSFGVEHNNLSGIFESKSLRESCPLLVEVVLEGNNLAYPEAVESAEENEFWRRRSSAAI